MIKLPKNLQQHNFYQSVKKLRDLGLPGWEILEESGLMALKAPLKLPLINFVWGEATLENIQKVKDFYQDQAHHWQLTTEQSDEHLLERGFTGPDLNIEMWLDLQNYQPKPVSPKISIQKIAEQKAYQIWAETINQTFKMGVEEFKEFFWPFIKYCGDSAYLGFYENKPAATSMIDNHNGIAGIHAMSTGLDFRRKGLGSAMLQVCLEEAKQKNLTQAVLYASAMGKPLYEKLGFKTTQILREYYLGKSD